MGPALQLGVVKILGWEFCHGKGKDNFVELDYFSKELVQKHGG